MNRQLTTKCWVRCSAWLGRVRNLIHAPQEYIRVTEIREDTTSTLRGQSCRSTPRANANKRNSDTATGTSIPNSVTNIHGAGKWLAISFACSLPGKPHNGPPVECIILRCCLLVVNAHPATRQMDTGGCKPIIGSMGYPTPD